MEFILDFQGFKNKDNEFIIKELAIISTDCQVYELQLFLPPCSLHDLPKTVRKQVHWVERHSHGLYWSSGFKGYSQIKDIFKNIDIRGNVYVKGLEKTNFIAQLLSEFEVRIINLEDLGCPKLSLLKERVHLGSFKPCSFSHSPTNCAYINVHVLLQWWNIEKQATIDTSKNIDLAIKEWVEKGYTMQDEFVKFLPKQFIINYVTALDFIYHKLPPQLQSDPNIIENLRCQEHYQFANECDEIDGPVIKRKYCYFCKQKINFDLQAKNENSTT